MSDYEVQVTRAEQPHGKRLSYRYDSPLEVGDRVVCPATPYSSALIGEVAALGRGDYDGPLAMILCRVAPDRPAPA
jgi:hypothetical protein